MVQLQELQDKHGLRQGNKLTSKNTHFQKNKIKVKLAVQVMSDSVATALKWAHESGVEGFEVLMS